MDIKQVYQGKPEAAQNQNANSAPQNQPKSSKSKSLKKLAFVAVPVVAVLVLAVGGVLLFQSRAQANEDWNNAVAAYQKGDYETAAQLIDGKSMPSEQERLLAYAQTKLATGKVEQALPAYEKLYETAQTPEYQNIIGNIYNQQQKYDKAAEAYQAVINNNKSYVQAYVNLATVRKLQGNQSAAVAVAKKGVEANPTNETMHELLVSMLLDDRDSDEYKQAIANLEKLNPEDPLLQSIKNSEI